MAKFCKKCGAALDEASGKCPSCDEIKKTTTRQSGDSKKKNLKRFITIFLIAVIAFVSVAVAFNLEPVKYNIALYMLEKGDYEKASEMISKLEDKKEDFVFCVGALSYESLESDTSNNQNYKCVYSYDDFGNCIEEKYIPESDDLKVSEGFIKTYGFDETGNCIKSAEYDLNKILKKSEDRFYDENNNVIKIEYKDENGSVTCTVVWEYDSENKRTVSKYINSSGEVYQICNYFYDSNDKCIKEEFVSPDGEIYRIHEFSYNSDGRCVKSMVDYCTEGWSLYCDRKYDVDGHCISEKDYSSLDSSQYQLSEYVYDENGKRVKKIYEQNGEHIEKLNATTIYSYDINGNLIEEKTDSYSELYGKSSSVTRYSDYKIFYKPESGTEK